MENKLMVPQSQSSLGFFEIISESFKTTRRNGKLLVPIILLVFVSFSQLDFADESILPPLTKDFMSQLADHPNMIHEFPYSMEDISFVRALHDLRWIVLVKLIIMAVSSIITLVFMIAIVSSSSEAYTAKALGPKDVFLKIKKSWKRPVVTSFYMILLNLGIGSFYMISIAVTTILAVNSWVVLFLGAMTLSIPVCYFYVSTLWTVSLIVSVLEEGVSGLKAIGRASELMKGRRAKASLMMVLFAIAYGFIILLAKFFRSYCLGSNGELMLTVPLRNGLYSLLHVFMYVVFTVFYHEWQTCNDGKQGRIYVSEYGFKRTQSVPNR